MVDVAGWIKGTEIDAEKDYGWDNEPTCLNASGFDSSSDYAGIESADYSVVCSCFNLAGFWNDIYCWLRVVGREAGKNVATPGEGYMTYRLEPWIRKIESMTILALPDGVQKRYISGRAAAADTFDRHYVVEKIEALSGEIVLTVKEVEVAGSTWVGEEQQGFF